MADRSELDGWNKVDRFKVLDRLEVLYRYYKLYVLDGLRVLRRLYTNKDILLGYIERQFNINKKEINMNDNN